MKDHKITLMEDEVFRAAVEGKSSFLSKHGVEFLKDQTTPQKNNIIHIAAEHGRAEFIKEALAWFPELGLRKNKKGDTPLYVAARKGYKEIVELLLVHTKEEEEESRARARAEDDGHDSPWMAQNQQGDTPLHLALSNNKLSVAMDLIQVGSTLAQLSLLNSSQETPLHVFVKYCTGSHTTSKSLLDEGVLNSQGEYQFNSDISLGTQRSSPSMSMNALKKLLEYKPAACMLDKDGLTPLLIAAQTGSFQALKFIIKHCPQSAEVCDTKGRTVLHHLKSSMIIDPLLEDHARDDDPQSSINGVPSTSYWKLKKLLNVPEVNAIKDAKDSCGNTPAYIALSNRNFVLAKVLFESIADFTIKNKDGVSALDHVKSIPDFATKMEEVTVTEQVLNRRLIDERLVQAAKEGNAIVLEQMASEIDIESGQVSDPYDLNDHFLDRTKQGLSILHVAIEHGRQEFVAKAMQLCPKLVFTTDSSGETPLHFGARLKRKHYNVATRLLSLTHSYVVEKIFKRNTQFSDAKPWILKNSKGNTPLHEALRFSNYEMAVQLMEIDPELSSVENNVGETPLHILARYGTYTKSDKIGSLVQQLIDQDETVVHKRDSDGFTPLLRAAHCGRIRVAYWIIQKCATTVQSRDVKGRNFLHFLRLEPTAELDFMTTEDMLYVYTNILVLTSKTEFDGFQAPRTLPLPVEDVKFQELRKLTGAGFDGLRSSQDVNGDTPLHFALRNNNFSGAKFLLLWCIKSDSRLEMKINNKDGHSVLDLLESNTDDPAYVRSEISCIRSYINTCKQKELKDLASMAQEKIIEEAFDKRMMDKQVYQNAVEGKIEYFFDKEEENHDGISSTDTGKTDCCLKIWKRKKDSSVQNRDHGSGATPCNFESQVAADGSNILHIALQHGQKELAREIMNRFPDLIWERDLNGDTPLHSYSKCWNANEFDEIAEQFKRAWDRICQNYGYNWEGLLIIPPSRVKNFQGNTPLHEACRLSSVPYSMSNIDSQPYTYVNCAGETPPHLLAKSSAGSYYLLFNMDCSKYARDKEGLTPLLSAAKAGHTFLAKKMLQQNPQSIQIRDDAGRSFFHHLQVAEEEDVDEFKSLFKISGIDAFRKTMDFEGNTPLHLATQSGNSMVAKLLAIKCVEADNDVLAGKMLRVPNNEGKSTLDFIASNDDAPSEVLQLLINKMESFKVHGLYVREGWVRSGYGICKSQIKDMTNTLSVVAGLLATITFAAAFQVPGGFDGGSGSPILLEKATAFKVFMISNSFAMCGSMIVLFSLLWVMLAGSVTTSFLLLDLSILILQLSFGATLMSFMTGVYAAVFHEAHWLGIFICTLCSAVIFFMRGAFIWPITQFFRFSLLAWARCKATLILILSKILPRHWSIRFLGVDPDEIAPLSWFFLFLFRKLCFCFCRARDSH